MMDQDETSALRNHIWRYIWILDIIQATTDQTVSSPG